MRKLCPSVRAGRFFFGLTLTFIFVLVCHAAALGQTITLDAPVSHSTSRYGQPLTISGTVSPADGWDVVVFDNKTYLGSATVSGGTFSYTTSLLPVGLHMFFVYGVNAGAVRQAGVVFHTITAAPSIDFTLAASYPIDGGGLRLTVADIDGNGTADLLVTCGMTLVTPLMGAGDGTFTKATQLTVGTDVTGIATGDFNKDGRVDFVVANRTDATAKVYFADGSGGWTPLSLTTNTGPIDVLVADFNLDARLDIATLNRNTNDVSIFLGDGAGGFAPKFDVPNLAGAQPQSMAVMSYNGDGYPDIVITNVASGATPLTVLPSNGPASFGPAVAYAGGTWSAEVADVNEDGHEDVVSTDYYSSGVYVSTGDTAGNLVALHSYATPSNPGRLALADINGDGHLDIAIPIESTNSVRTMYGDGTGAFDNARDFPVGSIPRQIKAGDFNGDGRTDLAVVNLGDNTVSILLGRGPDLTITKTLPYHPHQGETGVPYTITVTNSGDGPTSGTVKVVDNFPTAGMTATAISGTGWSCTLSTLTCTRSDVLDAGESYQPITLTVDVAIDAATGILNSATVSGGGEANTANDTAYNSATIIQVADLAIYMEHAPSTFSAGQTATFTIGVQNNGPSPTWGLVRVIDTLPAGLTATALSGTGWTCVLATLTCERVDDPIGVGAFYPDINLTVTVGSGAAPTVTNTAEVHSGGDYTFTNSTVSATVNVTPGTAPDMEVQKYHSGNFIKGQQGAAYTFDVYNSGGSPSTGTVTVTDPLPAGLTFNSVSGAGWSCTTPAVGANGTVSCSRSDALAPGSAYPGINLLVNVLPTASDFVNIATISGGGETNTDNDTENDPTTIVKAPSYISGGAGGSFGSFHFGANVLYAPVPGIVVSGVATGTVTFKEGATTLGTATLNSFANGSIDLPNLSAGLHNITVEYPGDAQFMASTGTFSAQVPKATPTVELLCPAATYNASAHSCTASVVGVGGATVAGSMAITYDGSSTAPTNAGSYAVVATFTSTDNNYSDATASTTFAIAGAPTTTTITGSPVTYPANVELTITISSPAGTPTGSAAISLGGGTPIPAPLNSGVITLGISGLSMNAGTHTISVSYPAQGNYAASSNTFDYVINPGSTGTSLTSSLNPAVPGNNVTFTATITGAGLMPSGNVAFRDGSTTLATVAVNAAGVATFTTSTLAIGTHSMTAVYAGDTRYSGSTSIPLSQVVAKPQVTITSGGASLTLKAGQSGNVNLSVGATGTLTAPITFTCTGLPLGSSCVFSPASVGPTVPATTTLTISTTGFQIVGQNRSHNWPVTLAILMPGMLLLPAVFSRRKRLAIILGIITVAMLVLALAGCGSGKVEGITNAPQSTPAGAYSVTVTGVSTGADNGTIPIHLTVNP